MTQEQGSRPRRRKKPRPSPVANFWRDTPTPVEPITPADDVTALLRSLGPAPLSAQLADFYIAAVIDRAAALATALAASADLLATANDPAVGGSGTLGRDGAET